MNFKTTSTGIDTPEVRVLREPRRDPWDDQYRDRSGTIENVLSAVQAYQESIERYKNGLGVEDDVAPHYNSQVDGPKFTIGETVLKFLGIETNPKEEQPPKVEPYPGYIKNAPSAMKERWAANTAVLAASLQSSSAGHPRTPKRPQLPGFVYLLGSLHGYKIGKSKSLEDRVRLLGILLPFETKLVHSIACDDPHGFERTLHQRYATQRINGEWFALSQEQVAEICSITGDTQ